MEEYHSSYTRSLHWHKLEVSCQVHDLAVLTPVKVSPYCDWLEGWLGPRAGLNAVLKWKVAFLYQELDLVPFTK